MPLAWLSLKLLELLSKLLLQGISSPISGLQSNQLGFLVPLDCQHPDFYSRFLIYLVSRLTPTITSFPNCLFLLFFGSKPPRSEAFGTFQPQLLLPCHPTSSTSSISDQARSTSLILSNIPRKGAFIQGIYMQLLPVFFLELPTAYFWRFWPEKSVGKAIAFIQWIGV